eukprot:SAG31_NODE_6540_length_1982_cov_164.242167_5_plen_21_part_01
MSMSCALGRSVQMAPSISSSE